MREIIEVAGRGRPEVAAAAYILLRGSEHAGKNITRRGEYISGVVKDDGTQVLLEIRQLDGRRAQLDVVDEQRFAADGKAGLQVARPGLVDGKSAVRIA